MSSKHDGEMPESQKKRPVQPMQPPRHSRAGMVWLLIMIMLGTMLMFKTFGPDQQRELNQTAFENMLAEKRIATINMSPDGEKIFRIEGELRRTDAAVNANQNPENKEYYVTRVIMSDTLESAMRESGFAFFPGKVRISLDFLKEAMYI